MKFKRMRIEKIKYIINKRKCNVRTYAGIPEEYAKIRNAKMVLYSCSL